MDSKELFVGEHVLVDNLLKGAEICAHQSGVYFSMNILLTQILSLKNCCERKVQLRDFSEINQF